jgi:sterol desaturase/sphingolipid hydroxylase (fatty acid hydroxylase superfamily)
MITVYITFGSLFAVALWELCLRSNSYEFPPWRRRVSNLGIWFLNIIAYALFFASPDRLRAPWGLPLWLGFPVGFLLLDFLGYAVHRAQHFFPWWWRLHALHHSDPDVDWSTSVRHHPLDYMLATTVFWLTVVAVGIPNPVVAAHALSIFTLAVCTHGNLRWPAWIERLLQPAVLTRELHRVHHSIELAEANTNFGAVLSVWDRLFRTFRRPDDARLVFGVRELERRAACRFFSMLATPWRL